MSQPKKYKSCASCRKSKLKCEYDQTKPMPVICDKCELRGVECVFDEKFDEKKAITAIDERLDKIESSIGLMVSLIRQHSLESHESSSSSPNVFPSPTNSSTITSKSEDSPMTNVHGQDVLNMRRGISFLPSIKYILNSRDVDIDPKTRNFDSAFPGTATGMLSEIVPNLPDSEAAKRQKRRKLQSQVGILPGQVTQGEIEQLLNFFTVRLARYLPVLIFHQIPKLDISLQHTSPLLFSSILAVASLYDSTMINKHGLFLSQFETIVREIDPNSIQPNADPAFIYQVLKDCLGLIIAGAWLGTEFGFRMSLMASDMIGRLLPDSEIDFNLPPELRPLFCSLGIGTYIIEQRLRIIHDRPVPYMYKGADYRTKRDLYLPMFLSETIPRKDFVATKLDPTQLKATANVELCSVMMMYQQEMNQSGRLPFNELMSWNAHLNGWLAEWIGKLTAHVKLSSWKPVILSFHFAKLFLNVRVLEHHEPIPQKEVIQVFGLAKNSAMDILEMLYDDDIRRLVSVSPVFYPTIFVTAGAFLLKLLHVSASLGYQLDKTYTIRVIRDTYKTLSEKISFEESPCFSTIDKLGECLRKVELEISNPSAAIPAIKQEILTRDTYSAIPSYALPPRGNSVNGFAFQQSPQPNGAPMHQQQVQPMMATSSSNVSSPQPQQDSEKKVIANSMSPTSKTEAQQLPIQGQQHQPLQQPPLQHPLQAQAQNNDFDIWKFDMNDPYFMTDAHSNILFQSVFNSK